MGIVNLNNSHHERALFFKKAKPKMKNSVLPIAALLVFQVGCKSRDFNAAGVKSQADSTQEFLSWSCKGSGNSQEKSSIMGQGQLRIFVEKQSLTYVVDKDGALKQALAPRKVIIEVVRNGTGSNLGKCQTKEVSRLKAQLLQRRNVTIQRQNGTHAVIQRFVADPSEQFFYADSGVQLFSEKTASQCPVIESVELNAQEKTVGVVFVRKSDGPQQYMLSNCDQISENGIGNICSSIKCD